MNQQAAPICPTHSKPMQWFENWKPAPCWKCTARVGTKPDGKAIYCNVSMNGGGPQAAAAPAESAAWTAPQAPETAPKPSAAQTLSPDIQIALKVIEAAGRVFQGTSSFEALDWIKSAYVFAKNPDASLAPSQGDIFPGTGATFPGTTF